MKYLGAPQSGSQANTTASRNRFGQYYRTRAVPVNPSSPTQAANRTRLAMLSSSWRGLTDGSRAAWEAYALAHPRVNSLGASIILTGAQMFIAIATSRSQAGEAFSTNPPADPTFTNPITGVTSAAGAVTVANAAFTDSTVKVFSSPPVSPGRNFNGDYRWIRNIAADDAGTVDIGPDLASKWGDLPDGAKFFLRFIETQDGVENAPQEFTVIYVA